jgi:hypothetical protein
MRVLRCGTGRKVESPHVTGRPQSPHRKAATSVTRGGAASPDEAGHSLNVDVYLPTIDRRLAYLEGAASKQRHESQKAQDRRESFARLCLWLSAGTLLVSLVSGYVAIAGFREPALGSSGGRVLIGISDSSLRRQPKPGHIPGHVLDRDRAVASRCVEFLQAELDCIRWPGVSADFGPGGVS